MGVSPWKLSQSSYVRPLPPPHPPLGVQDTHWNYLHRKNKKKPKKTSHTKQINIQRNCMKRIPAVKEQINDLKKLSYRNKVQHFLLIPSSGHSLYDIPKFLAFYSTFCVQSKCQQIRLTVFNTEKISQVGYWEKRTGRTHKKEPLKTARFHWFTGH